MKPTTPASGSTATWLQPRGWPSSLPSISPVHGDRNDAFSIATTDGRSSASISLMTRTATALPPPRPNAAAGLGTPGVTHLGYVDVGIWRAHVDGLDALRCPHAPQWGI